LSSSLQCTCSICSEAQQGLVCNDNIIIITIIIIDLWAYSAVSLDLYSLGMARKGDGAGMGEKREMGELGVICYMHTDKQT